jgi:uncharacterized membrane protein YbhN (UPF0104 family)
MKRYALLALKLGVLAALLALAVVTQNLREIWALISGANLIYLLYFLVLAIAAVALATTNLFLLLRPLGKKLPWLRLFYFDRLSMWGAYYTPGGIGGLGSLVFMMSREGVGLKDSIVAVMADKVVTLIVALLFTAVYLLVYHSGALAVKWYELAALALLAMFGAVAMSVSTWARESARKIFDRLGCYRGQYGLLLANMIITVSIFGLVTTQFIVAFSAVGIEVTDWRLILVSYGILLLINHLPITFGGIGLGEAAAVLLWAGLGITSEQILSAFLLTRVFTLVSTMLLGGEAMIAWSLERRGADHRQDAA